MAGKAGEVAGHDAAGRWRRTVDRRGQIRTEVLRNKLCDYPSVKGNIAMTSSRISSGIVTLVTVVFLASCRPQDEKQTPKAKDIDISVSLTNVSGDKWFREISEQDSTVTKEKIESYTRAKIASLLKKVRFPLETDPRDYVLKVTMSLAVGLKKEILTDPGTSVQVTGGSVVLSVPTLKLDGELVADGTRVMPPFTFEGGLASGSPDWPGVARLCDMGIGHCLKELAKSKIAAEQIAATLTRAGLLPRSPYTSATIVAFGSGVSVRFHQDGNLWEALGEIGEPAWPALRDGTKDADKDVKEEAAKILASIGKGNRD